MHVLFIYPNVRKTPEIPLGISYLSAVLKRDGHTTSIFDTTFTLNISDYRSFPEAEARKAYDALNKQIAQEKPNLIAISSTSGDYPFVERLLNRLEDKTTPVVVGGIHATICPEEVIVHERVNMLCRGEGEEAMQELAQKLSAGKDISNIQNLWIKQDGEVIKNDIRPLLEDLDRLPYPDNDLFDKRHFIFRHRTANRKKVNYLAFETSRGCPYPCTYCQNHQIQKMYRGKGKYVRFKSVGRCIEEMKHLVKQHNIDVVAILDETFIITKKDRIAEFCRRYKEEIGLPFHITLRPEVVLEEPLLMLKDAGCRTCSIGIETAGEEYRKKYLKRNTSDKQIIDAFATARKVGLSSMSFNIVGLPYQTREDVFENIALTRKANPDYSLCSILYPYPKTDIWELCKREGYLKDDRVMGEFFADSILRMPQITQSEIRALRRTFQLYCKAPERIFPLIRLLEKESMMSTALCTYFQNVCESGWTMGSVAFLQKVKDRLLSKGK